MTNGVVNCLCVGIVPPKRTVHYSSCEMVTARQHLAIRVLGKEAKTSLLFTALSLLLALNATQSGLFPTLPMGQNFQPQLHMAANGFGAVQPAAQEPPLIYGKTCVYRMSRLCGRYHRNADIKRHVPVT